MNIYSLGHIYLNIACIFSVGDSSLGIFQYTQINFRAFSLYLADINDYLIMALLKVLYLYFLARQVVNMAVNKTDTYRVRYHFSHACVTNATSCHDLCNRLTSGWVRHAADAWQSSFISSPIVLLCRVRNKIMYVLLWRPISPFSRVLLWCALRSLLHNWEKHQNNTLMVTLNSSPFQYTHHSLIYLPL